MSAGDFTVVYVGSTENSKNDLMDDGEYEEKEDKIKWTDDKTASLISVFKEEYPKFFNSTTKRNAVWMQIRNKFNDLHDTNYTFNQVRDKVNNLKKGYTKKRRTIGNSGERSHFRWYNEMDEIIGRDQEIVNGIDAKESGTDDSRNQKGDMSDSEFETDYETPLKKRKLKSIDYLTNELKLIREQRERHHKKNCEFKEKMILLLEKLIENK